MKHLILLPLLLSMGVSTFSQKIEGKVLDAKSGQPLEYASIGIINTRFGTITNDSGEFKLEAKEEKDTSTIRFSMIGYEAKSFKVNELLNKKNIIRLTQKPVEIAEVIVKPGNKFRKVGTTDRSLRRICGWEGNKRGQGHEIGSEFKLGEQVVRLESLTGMDAVQLLQEHNLVQWKLG